MVLDFQTAHYELRRIIWVYWDWRVKQIALGFRQRPNLGNVGKTLGQIRFLQ